MANHATLCGTAVSRSRVSELTKRPDTQLDAWRNRPLDEQYCYLMVDARYEKVRTRQGLVSQGVMLQLKAFSALINYLSGTTVVTPPPALAGFVPSIAIALVFLRGTNRLQPLLE